MPSFPHLTSVGGIWFTRTQSGTHMFSQPRIHPVYNYALLHPLFPRPMHHTASTQRAKRAAVPWTPTAMIPALASPTFEPWLWSGIYPCFTLTPAENIFDWHGIVANWPSD